VVTAAWNLRVMMALPEGTLYYFAKEGFPNANCNSEVVIPYFSFE
jgi:uncharacterized protein (DUF3820 family)